MDLQNSPPRRPRDLLAQWIEDFTRDRSPFPGSLKVANQEDDGQEDTGLVIMTFSSAPATVAFHPAGYDDVRWRATLLGDDDDLTLDVHQLASFAAEMVIASNLCTYLQWRSLEWDRDSGNH